ncbi:LysR family transcriptional regulator [Bradyrhizobium sp. dw_78]|uniref:LysR family transcriptional regulator n=1 Tax=Bradyrhizobium sp. dw_78 TaxID=2719793 RepID=UPI001BD25E0A|nr:LysR family transcriptional regulator [Bradyrhizobium sp. dw_78]
MKHRPSDLEWTDLQTLLEVAREKNATAAAARLGIDVTTVRRRLAALQQALGIRLFVKNGRSLQLTNDGERIVAVATGMEGLSKEITRGATDAARDLVGVVRISTMEGFGSFYLAPRLSQFIGQHPRLSVELVSSQHIVNLSEREADVSLNMVRPQHGRLMVRKASQFAVGLYAAQAYLDANGHPASIAALEDHTFITYVDELVFVPHVRWLPDVVKEPKVRFTSTSLVSQYEATCAGAGLAMLPHFMAARRPGLIRVLPAEINLVRDWWLVVHQDLQAVPRIRAITDFITTTMRHDSRVLMSSDEIPPLDLR